LLLFVAAAAAPPIDSPLCVWQFRDQAAAADDDDAAAAAALAPAAFSFPSHAAAAPRTEGLLPIAANNTCEV
jgi:hypothetical protein